MNLLEQLKQQTKIVSDTGDIESVRKFRPTDATTNPSLIYTAAKDPKYMSIVDRAIEYAKTRSDKEEEQLSLALDKLIVDFGLEILKIIPGRVSTEVDARLSFDIEGSVNKAEQLIKLYSDAGIGPERVLIKVASTWEGIKTAEILTQKGINCNMTLLFSMSQAIASAEIGVKLVSPFVGRILDWHKKNVGTPVSAADEPGVVLVRNIFNYYKKFGYETEIMGASFRNTGEIIQLAGCDLLTIAPNLLNELEQTQGLLENKLNPEMAKNQNLEKISIDEKKFRWMMNEDAMATDKLSEGIRKFSEDIIKLEKLLTLKLHSQVHHFA
jgi:transaldolase